MSEITQYMEEQESTTPLARQLERATGFRLVVPSKTSTRRSLPLRHWTDVIIDAVLPLSGGAIEIPGRGHWLNAEGRRVTESVRLLDIYLPHRLTLSDSERLVAQFALWAASMQQEALAVVVNDRLHLVRPATQSIVTRDTESRRQFLRTVISQNGHAGGAMSERPTARQRRSG